MRDNLNIMQPRRKNLTFFLLALPRVKILYRAEDALTTISFAFNGVELEPVNVV